MMVVNEYDFSNSLKEHKLTTIEQLFSKEKVTMPKQYIVSERAHFMCPNMHFGFLMQLNGQYDDEKVQKTLNILATAHPFLRSVIAHDLDEEKLYYSVCEQSKIEIHVKNDSSSLWYDYREVGKQSWNIFENGLLKVFLYPEKMDFRCS